MSTRTARAVGDLLLDAVPRLAERLATYRLQQSWASVAGREIARRTQPNSLVNGCLGIVVDNSPWLHELTLRQAELLERLRAHCPDVQSIRLSLGTIARASSPPSTRAARPASLDARARDDVERAVATIPDPDVAAAARRLMTRALQFPRSRGAAR